MVETGGNGQRREWVDVSSVAGNSQRTWANLPELGRGPNSPLQIRANLQQEIASLNIKEKKRKRKFLPASTVSYLGIPDNWKRYLPIQQYEVDN